MVESAPALGTISVWVHAARPKTLPAAAAPVLVGIALAVAVGAFHWGAALCALLGALLIQIGTNLANDYQDFLKGADTEHRQGPIRITQAGLATPEMVKRATIFVFGLAFLSGVYLIYRGGWPILLIGLISIALGMLYTGGKYSLAYLGIADFFVLIFFGPVAVAGTFYVQAVGNPEALFMLPNAILAGFGPGFIATAILLANNIRDVEEDRIANKKTLVVRLGRNAGLVMYYGCFVAAAMIAVLLWLRGGAPAQVIGAAIVLLPAIGLVRTMKRSRDYAVVGPVLGKTGGLLLVYSVLLSIGILW